MAVDDTFKGAKTGLTFLHAYFNMVAQKIGIEQARALDTKTSETLGAAQGKMLKEQAKTEEVDVRTAVQLLSNLIEEGLGIRSEVVDESPQKITCRLGRCPVYESAKALGMDDEAIEAGCRAGSIRFMDAAAKELNPNLNYQLTKFRSSADDYCIETIVQA